MHVSKYACLLLIVRVYACMYVRMSLCVHVCMQARTDGRMECLQYQLLIMYLFTDVLKQASLISQYLIHGS